MGAWGIRERQSDYGLDLLGTIVGTQLKAVDFAIFNTAEAIELLRQDIMEDIKRTNRGCPPEGLDCYINANFPRDFTHAALLIAECLADYYRTGELIVTEYVGENYDPVDHHIKEFVVTPETSCQGLFNTVHRIFKKSTQQKPGAKWLPACSCAAYSSAIIRRTSSRSIRLILSSIVSVLVSLKCAHTR